MAAWKQSGIEIVAPALLEYEVTLALWKATTMKIIIPEDAISALHEVAIISVQKVLPTIELHQKALNWVAGLPPSGILDGEYLALAGVLIILIALGTCVSEEAGEPMGDVRNLGDITYGEFMADLWAAIQEAEPKCQIGSVASFVTLVPAFSVFYTSLALYPGWYPHSSTNELIIGNTTIVSELPI